MYLTPAARAAKRALSLLPTSLEKGEASEFGCDLSEKGIRSLPIEFLEELVEYVADHYGPMNWIEGIPMDIQFVAFTHRYQADRYGNDHLIELQYNEKGHRCILAMSQENWLRMLIADPQRPHLSAMLEIYMD